MTKKWLIAALFLTLAGMFLLPGCSDDDEENNTVVYSITITSPSAGVEWLTGTAYSITWTDQNVDTFDIQLSVNNGTSYANIATSVVGNSYLWTVPTTPAPTCKIKVLRHGDVNTFAASGAFAIVRPALLGGWDANTATLTSLGLDSMFYGFENDLTYEWYRFVEVLDYESRETGTFYVDGDSVRFHMTLLDGVTMDSTYARKYTLANSNNELTVRYIEDMTTVDMVFDRVQ